MKKKFKKLFQKLFIIPRYEKRLEEKDTEIQTLIKEKNFFQSQMYKYKNTLIRIRHSKKDNTN